ncbi:MAG: hypothetical protein NZ483_00490 [Verrucomicrobiae bacterium]|nr:hypothetical protein [Verrucomicrobiae bacterium]
MEAEYRLYHRLSTEAKPDADGDFKKHLNQHSPDIVTAKCEPSLTNAKPKLRDQFERLAYFAVYLYSKTGKLVFNRTITLKDTWAKIEKKGNS